MSKGPRCWTCGWTDGHPPDCGALDEPGACLGVDVCTGCRDHPGSGPVRPYPTAEERTEEAVALREEVKRLRSECLRLRDAAEEVERIGTKANDILRARIEALTEHRRQWRSIAMMCRAALVTAQGQIERAPWHEEDESAIRAIRQALDLFEEKDHKST